MAVAMIAVVFAGCVAGDARYATADPAGFFMGLWHGIISVVTLIISAFDQSVQVYERNNTGALYDFGFLLAAIAVWGGALTMAMQRGRGARRIRT